MRGEECADRESAAHQNGGEQLSTSAHSMPRCPFVRVCGCVSVSPSREWSWLSWWLGVPYTSTEQQYTAIVAAVLMLPAAAAAVAAAVRCVVLLLEYGKRSDQTLSASACKLVPLVLGYGSPALSRTTHAHTRTQRNSTYITRR